MLSVVSPLPGSLELDPRSVTVKFVVDKVALGPGLIQVLIFPLSVSFHQSSILSSTYMLPARRANIRNLRKTKLFRTSENIS